MKQITKKELKAVYEDLLDIMDRAEELGEDDSDAAELLNKLNGMLSNACDLLEEALS